MKIPLVKTIDYKYDKELQKKLENTANPMAMVVRTQLKSSEVKGGDDEKKYAGLSEEEIKRLVN